MKVIMNGALGKMGRQILSLLEEGKNGTELAVWISVLTAPTPASSKAFPILQARLT